MPERYPGYDVLAKRHTPSWNEQTRRVIDQRLATPRTPRFLLMPAFLTLEAIATHIVPQPGGRPPIPVAGLVDAKLFENHQDGFRNANLPAQQEAWRRALDAIDAEALFAHQKPFVALTAAQQLDLLKAMEAGTLRNGAWGNIPPKSFFKHRLLPDIVKAYWSHPTAWNEIGWGGPAAPRGYVRMGYDERDPWEAQEASGSHHGG